MWGYSLVFYFLYPFTGLCKLQTAYIDLQEAQVAPSFRGFIGFGPQTLHKLPNLYNEKEKSNENQIDISFPKLEKFDHLASPKAEGPSVFVSIMEGCN